MIPYDALLFALFYFYSNYGQSIYVDDLTSTLQISIYD
jgi:hypothetical protein